MTGKMPVVIGDLSGYVYILQIIIGIQPVLQISD